ncbi:hypothetical protein LCGC14_1884450, partial [marine sediment metagenome]
SNAGQFDAPAGIDVDGHENVYVADFNNHRIQKFNSHGRFLKAWGRQGRGVGGELYYPTRVKGDPAGKPDLVGLNESEALIVEVKSGKQRESDAWQVLIYWFALKIDWLKDTGLTIKGEVAYKGGVTRKVEALSPLKSKAIADLLKVVTGDDEPPTTPGKWDCEYCEIIGCTARFQAAEAADASGVF